jgi:aryl-alcohol dehydrogenase-like predicted oxidoreductase
MFSGHATADGTLRYAQRFSSHQSFYRIAQEWTVSSVGLGTYLGGMDDEADESYRKAIAAAVKGGINVLDAAINYRHQRSERSIGAALADLFKEGIARRDEVVVCTKAGFLTPGAIDRTTLDLDQVVGRSHSMAPEFLDDQIDRCRQNLGLETIDVFYLHNPETQTGYVDRAEFLKRLAAAFERLEKIAADGRIVFYGTATWDGYRKSPPMLELESIVDLARDIAGDSHHFRFIQLPFNLAMTEAFGNRNQPSNGSKVSLLEAAAQHGISVVGSASILQSRLASGLPETLHDALPGLTTDAQRALQFARSAPRLAVALVGMGREEHVAQNLGVAAVPPVDAARFAELFR